MYAKNPRWFLTEEQDALRESVARLARERVAPRAAEVDATAQYPQDIFELLAQNGLTGITIPEAYGGCGRRPARAVRRRRGDWRRSAPRRHSCR